MTPAPEAYRPQFHLTPAEGWLNDPNGLVFFNGEWHAFYQYFHAGGVEGMEWGHAVSTDLAHWTRLPPALSPDALGHIWSGSAVVDTRDSSGLFGGKPGLVCVFTYFDPTDGRQCQGLGYSADGRRFEKFAGNPVIPQLRRWPGQPDDKDFRDPKVFWHAETARWIMAVAGGKLRIFSSTDLLHWHFESVAEDLHTECPDLFPMAVDGDPTRRQWVLSGCGRWYMVGRFDGHRFTPETARIPVTDAPDFYASQTFSDAPDGRRIMLTWLYTWQYGNKLKPSGIEHPFPTRLWSGGGLTVPYELALRSTSAGPRLSFQPVAELARLRSAVAELRDVTVQPGGANPLAAVRGKALDVELVFERPRAGRLVFRFPATAQQSYELVYDAERQQLTLDRRNHGFDHVNGFGCLIATALAAGADNVVALRVLLDHNSLEVFSADGRTLLPAMLLPDPAADGLECRAEGAPFRLRRASVFAMHAAVR